ncbi:MAG: DUF2284 domain-containing protein [Treponema sp.]|jgi:predicted metal-binding protein|nr:DUF2284 domain-containing protein [Treponema sp.]
MDYNKILYKAAVSAGVSIHEWKVIPAAALVFSAGLLDYCKTNACGNYNKSWTCPPVCESADEQKKKILSHEKILVFTTKHVMEDSFDYEGMTKGRELHALLTAEVKKKFKGSPVYGAGSCPVCTNINGRNVCSFPKRCRFPKKMIGSIEAAGVNVTELSKAAGIAYNNGPGTVTFFSMVPLNITE